MGKKKEPTLQDGLKIFKDVMTRASLSDYTYVNRVMLSKSPKGHTILIIPDVGLWNLILDDPDIRPHLRSLDINDANDRATQPLFAFGESIDGPEWIDIDPEILRAGKVINITIDGFEYEPVISRECLPVKLRKAEYNEITYRVFLTPSYVLALKKHFSFQVEGGSFTMMRLFKIL